MALDDIRTFVSVNIVRVVRTYVSANIISLKLMVLVLTTVVCCVIREVLRYLWSHLYVIMASKSSK